MCVGIGVRGGAARRNGGAQRAALLTGGAAAVGERSMGGRRGKAAGGMGMEPGAREMMSGEVSESPLCAQTAVPTPTWQPMPVHVYESHMSMG